MNIEFTAQGRAAALAQLDKEQISADVKAELHKRITALPKEADERYIKVDASGVQLLHRFWRD